MTDNLTGLVWELKTDLNGGYDFTKPHDADNFYAWSTGAGNEDGTVFTTFLTTGLNTPGFAGANGWRMPTFAELQTILLDFPCTGPFGGAKCKCPTTPTTWCVYSALDAANTQGSLYWSATSYVQTS